MNKKVIIARDPEKAAPLIAELTEHGVQSFAVPVTRVEPYSNTVIPADLITYDIIAFTSTNALTAFKVILNSSNIELSDKIKLAAVGGGTASAVQDAFGRVDIIPDEQNAASLANAIINKGGDRGGLRIFWPCAKHALPDFGNELNKADVEYTPWICYETAAMETRQIRSRLQSLAPWDLVFFAAPSAVEAFSEAWEDRSGFIAIAIGPTTEAVLRRMGFRNIAVSGGTSAIQCAGAIIDALGLKVWS